MRLPILATLLAAVLAVSACGAEAPSAAPAVTTAPQTSAPAVTPSHHASHRSTSRPGPKTTGDPRSRDTRTLADKVQDQLRAKPQPKPKPKPKPIRDPLAAHAWGVYQGPQEAPSRAYATATGANRTALAAIALTPKAEWMGAWIANKDIAQHVHDYVASATGGDPDKLVQITVFRMVPWEHDTCARRPTAAEAASYRDWIDRFAGALGTTNAAIVLQPDGPFALCAPGGPTDAAGPVPLIRYAAQKLSALPNTSVYLEAGAADWPAEGQGGVDAVLRFLVPEGVEYVRGISMDTTHYASTEDDIRRGVAIVQALAAQGITGKHVVLNTALNGDPHEFLAGNPKDPNDLPVCSSPSDPTSCESLGIPPTTDVANPQWGLPADAARLARKYVDAYLWVARPWLHKGNYPFILSRALTLVQNAKYRSLLPTG